MELCVLFFDEPVEFFHCFDEDGHNPTVVNGVVAFARFGHDLGQDLLDLLGNETDLAVIITVAWGFVRVAPAEWVDEIRKSRAV